MSALLLSHLPRAVAYAPWQPENASWNLLGECRVALGGR